MKRTAIGGIVSCLLVLALAQAGLAVPANLYLYKRDPFAMGSCGICSQYLNFVDQQNRPTLSDYQFQAQTGYYWFLLDGPPGTMVTLFAKTDYATGGGYLVVVKKDQRQIAVRDLTVFPSDKWTAVPSEDDQEGAYSVYYKHGENFHININSVKWGQWWKDGAIPPPGN